MGQLPTLSKSRYMAGQQCHKRLYLECFNRELATPVDSQSQARFDEGQRVGELARALRPGGVLIEEDHLHPREAIESTARALANPDVPAIYEAAFQYEDVLIRVDVLARTTSRSFEFIEVKSSTKTKPEHKPDVGIQLWVLEGAGLTIDRAILAHLNNAYEYTGGECETDKLFTLVDLTAESRASQEKYLAALQAMRKSLQEAKPPVVDVGPHCKNPYECNFLMHCRAALPQDPIQELHDLRAGLRNQLSTLGIKSISEIPIESVSLNDIQRRMCKSIQSGEPILDKRVRTRLLKWGLPLHFLDFETVAPALPFYVGTTPYEPVPFQWSLHTITRNGSLEHREYLQDGTDDPRPRLTSELLEAVGDEGQVVHYSDYEATIIRGLKGALPQFSDQLGALDTRLVDLRPEISAHYYNPAMQGSFSLKSVYPALLPDKGYEGQEISDGMMASQAFLEMIQPDTSANRRALIREGLLSYCRLDTKATVEIYRVLSGEM